MNATRNVALNTVAQMAGFGLSFSMNLVITALLTRALGPSAFGEYSAVIVFLYFFMPLIDFGISIIGVREYSRNTADQAAIFRQLFSFKFYSGLIVFLLVNAVTYFLPYPPHVKVGIVIASLSLVFRGLITACTSLFQSQFKLYYSVLGEILGRGGYLLIVIVLTGAGLRLPPYQLFLTAIAGLTIADLVTLSVNLSLVRRIVPLKLTLNITQVVALLRKSVIAGVIMILSAITFKIDSFILSFLRGSAELGIYSVAYRILEFLFVFPGVFMNAAFPVLLRITSHQRSALESAIQRSLDLLSLIAFPLIFGGVVVAPQLIRLIAGDAFLAAARPLQILLIPLAAIFLNSLVGYLIYLRDQERLFLRYIGWTTLVTVVLDILAIQRFGYLGAAVVTAIMEMVGFIINCLIAYRLYHFRPRLHNVGKSLLAASIMAIILLFIRAISFPVTLLVGIITYTCFLVLLRAIDWEVIRFIFSKRATTPDPTLNIPSSKSHY